MDNQFAIGHTIGMSRPIACVLAFRFLFQMPQGSGVVR